MKVIKISDKSGYSMSNNKYMEFERYEKKAGDYILLEGGFEQDKQWDQFEIPRSELKKLLKKKIVRLDFEEPNKFFVGDNPDTYDHYFYKVLTLCPYTAEWLNKKQGVQRRIPVFYPQNENYLPKKERKIYDIIYAGHIVSQKLLSDLETMSTFNYRFVSNSAHPLVTNKNATHEEKLKLSAQTKITLVHNVLYPKPYHIFNIWRTPGYRDNEAFKMVPRPYEVWKLAKWQEILVPQLKARLFEAAFTRSIILCRYDEFNVIEHYFEPEKEFVYFREGELGKTIKKILKNYDNYKKVAERAYARSIKEYTTDAFFRRYLKNLK